MNNYQVNREKWQRLSIFEQMGNIYSEVGRTLAARRRGDNEAAKAAAKRALDLFDATSESLARQKSPKLLEVLRVRELFGAEFTTGIDQKLDAYFLQFAIAARRRQTA